MKNHMHLRALSATTMALLVVVAGICQPAISDDAIILDRIIAVVDEDVVLQSELDARIARVKAQLASADSPLPPEQMLVNQVLERLILENLQLNMGHRGGIRISDEQLNEAMQRIANRNNLSLLDFQRALAADGLSYAEMREEIRREMIIGHVQQSMVNGRLTITDQEINNFLESDVGKTVTADEYRVSHILISLPDKPTRDQIAAARNEAEAVVSELRQGADFAGLAAARSAGQRALTGGDLGWRKVVQIPTIFADVVPTLSASEVHGPIKSGSGYHIIKLMEVRGAVSEGQIEQTEVRHVLIQPSEIRTEQEAMELAELLREETMGGKAFDEIARLHSDDPGSALSGGDLGWSAAGLFVPEFEDQMHRSEIGDISPVFRTEHGYHFLEVTGRRIEDFSEEFKRQQAENYIRNQRFDEELQVWAREAREDAFVEIRM